MHNFLEFCRIYPDIKGAWVMGWYDAKQMWQSKRLGTKDELIAHARSLGFVAYIDGHGTKKDNLIQL